VYDPEHTIDMEIAGLVYVTIDPVNVETTLKVNVSAVAVLKRLNKVTA